MHSEGNDIHFFLHLSNNDYEMNSLGSGLFYGPLPNFKGYKLMISIFLVQIVMKLYSLQCKNDLLVHDSSNLSKMEN